MSGRCLWLPYGIGSWRPLSAELRQAESGRPDMKIGRLLTTKVGGDWSVALVKTLSMYTPSLYSTLLLLTLYQQLSPAGGIPRHDHSPAVSPDTRTDNPVANAGWLTSASPSDDSWPDFGDPRWMIHGDNLSGLRSMVQLLENNINRLRDSQLAHGDNKVDEDTLKILLYEAMSAACLEKYRHLEDERDEGQIYCNSTFDRVLCWPTTPAGEIAVQPCPQEFAGMKYLKYGNASKICYPNGTWELKTDYNQCHPEFGLSDPANIHNYVVRWLYYVGFTVSIVSCVIALFIFLYFKALQCVRNKIHCHLIVTFVLRNLLWLIMNNTFPIFIQDDQNYIHQIICKGVVTLFNYAQVTNFFWMLVEGLYLHFMVVWAFSIEMIKFLWYIVLGWCAPAVIILIWVIVKLRLQNNSCWLPEKNSSSDYEYIYIVPVLLVLVVNVIFLISIVVVLITKLRATNTILARQYKIAVKATVILLPLLGGTYILFICSPGEEKLVSNLIFIYFNTILQSTQGLAVTTFYCFLNGEVRATIKNRYNRWREGRTVTTRYTRGSVATSNGETLGLQSNFRLTNGISNGPAAEVALRNILRNDCAPDRSRDTLISRPRDEEQGHVDDGAADDMEGNRDVTLL